MSDLEHTCVMCKHMYLTLGCPDYSEVTPGEHGELTCLENQQPPLTREPMREFRRWVRFGNTCQKFEVAADEP